MVYRGCKQVPRYVRASKRPPRLGGSGGTASEGQLCYRILTPRCCMAWHTCSRPLDCRHPCLRSPRPAPPSTHATQCHQTLAFNSDNLRPAVNACRQDEIQATQIFRLRATPRHGSPLKAGPCDHGCRLHMPLPIQSLRLQVASPSPLVQTPLMFSKPSSAVSMSGAVGGA